MCRDMPSINFLVTPRLRKMVKQRGDRLISPIYEDQYGRWAIVLCPFGESGSKPGHCAVYLDCLGLHPGITRLTVKGGTLRAMGSSRILVTKELPARTVSGYIDTGESHRVFACVNFIRTSLLPGDFALSVDFEVDDASVTQGFMLRSVLLQPSTTLESAAVESAPVTDTRGCSWSLVVGPPTADGTLSCVLRLVSLPPGVRTAVIDARFGLLHDRRKIRTLVMEKSLARPACLSCSVEREVGMVDFCRLEDLPSAFLVQCEVCVRLLAHDKLLASVPDTTDLMAHKAPWVLSEPYIHENGTIWDMMYTMRPPVTDKDEASLAVYVRIRGLPAHIHGLRIKGRVRIVSRTTGVHERAIPVSPWLSTRDKRQNTWGFNAWTGLGTAFVIRAYLEMESIMTSTPMEWPIDSFQQLQAQHPRGRPTCGPGFVDHLGIQWCLNLFPQGHERSTEGYCSLFLSLVELPPEVETVAVRAIILVKQGPCDVILQAEFDRPNRWFSLNGGHKAVQQIGAFDFLETRKLNDEPVNLSCRIEHSMIARRDYCALDVSVREDGAIELDGMIMEDERIHGRVVMVHSSTGAIFCLAADCESVDVQGRPHVHLCLRHIVESKTLFLKEARLIMMDQNCTLFTFQQTLEGVRPLQEGVLVTWGDGLWDSFQGPLRCTIRVQLTLSEESASLPTPERDLEELLLDILGPNDQTVPVRGPRRNKKGKKKPVIAPAGPGQVSEMDTPLEDTIITPPSPVESPPSPVESPPSPVEPSPALVIEDEDEMVLDSMLCPISHCIMQDPVMAPDLHTYDRVHLDAWIAKAQSLGVPVCSPLTREVFVKGFKLLPNLTIRKMIQEYLESVRSGQVQERGP